MNSVWTSRRAVALLTLACLSSACGDDAVGGDAGTEVPIGKKLPELDVTERSEVCDAFAKRLDRLFTQPEYERLSCTRQAAPVSFQVSQDGVLGGNAELCQRLVGDCVKNGGALGDDPPATTLSEDLFDVAGCKAGDQFRDCGLLVRDFERCSQAFAAQLATRFQDVTCDALSDPERTQRAFGQDVDPASISSCEAFTTECPSVGLDSNIDGRAARSGSAF